MGLRLGALAAALAVALPGGGPVQESVRFLETRKLPSGGFAEAGGQADPGLTAWVALGLRAGGASPDPAVREYLVAREDELRSATDIELGLLGQLAAGARQSALTARLLGLVRRDGSIGPTVSSTIWGVIALAQAGERIPPRTVRYLLARQAASGGWSWAKGGAPDSNDTAVALQALIAAGVFGKPVRRGLVYLRRLQNRDGGFGLIRGRGSDAQSTAWAIQAFLAAGKQPGRAAYRYLARMRRADGSYRYSARYAITPVWVTAQVLPALAGQSLVRGMPSLVRGI